MKLEARFLAQGKFYPLFGLGLRAMQGLNDGFVSHANSLAKTGPRNTDLDH